MEKRNNKAWLYLLPALAFLVVFLVYPLIDVFVYSLEEGYNSASQSYYGIGLYNFSYVLHDPYFIQALKNTFILVFITVPDVAAAQPDSQSNLLSHENSASPHLLSVLDTIRDYERSLYSETRQQERLELYFLLTQEHPSTDFPNEAYNTLNK